MAIRNANVARGISVAAGLTTMFTVPTGFVLLIKHVTVYNNGSAQTDANVRIFDPPTSTPSFLFRQTLAAADFFTWQSWAAANAGQVLLLQSANANLAYWVDGALLPFNPTLI